MSINTVNFIIFNNRIKAFIGAHWHRVKLISYIALNLNWVTWLRRRNERLSADDSSPFPAHTHSHIVSLFLLYSDARQHPADLIDLLHGLRNTTIMMLLLLVHIFRHTRRHAQNVYGWLDGRLCISRHLVFLHRRLDIAASSPHFKGALLCGTNFPSMLVCMHTSRTPICIHGCNVIKINVLVSVACGMHLHY